MNSQTKPVGAPGRRVFGFALVVFFSLAAARSARADNERVKPDKAPDAVQAVAARETRGAHDVVFYRIDNGFNIHYSLPSGLRLETRVRRDGSVIHTKPTDMQPEVSKKDVNRLFDRYQADRGREARLPDADRTRAAVERERAEADRARQEADALRAALERERAAQRRREDEARRDRARRMEEREAADFYSSRRYERMEYDTAPPSVRRTWRDESGRATDVEYYRYSKGSDWLYATQYTTESGRRIELITDASGQVVDRIEISDRPVARADVRDRDRAWDRERGWDRDRDRMTRLWIPARPREALDGMTAGANDVDYYRLRDERGRTVYAARYTDLRGRRVESRLSEDGELIETVTTYSVADPDVGRDPRGREERADELRALSYDDVPRDVRDAIRSETRAAGNVDYFTTRHDGRVVYVARFTVDAGRRYELRVDEAGRILGRTEIRDAGYERF